MSNLNPKSNQFIGLDIGSYSIKIIETSMKDNAFIIEKVLSVEIPLEVDKQNADSLDKWISGVWKTENIKIKNVRLVIPRHQILLTELELPSGDDSETKQMLELQLERVLPVPIDSVKSDYFLQSVSELGDRKIMVISTKNDLIDFYKTVIRQAGLNLETIELSSLCLTRSIQSLQPSIDFWMAINIGYSNTEFIVVDKGRMIFSHSASLGSRNIVENNDPSESLSTTDPVVQSWINRLTFEIKRSMESFNLEFGKSAPTHLFISGGVSRVSGLFGIIGDKLGDKIQTLDISSKLKDTLRVSPGITSDCVIVYGTLIPVERTSQYCDLLHPKLYTKEPSHINARMRQVAIGVGCALLIVGTLIGLLYQKQKKLTELQTEYGKYRSLVTQSEQVSASASVVRSWKQDQNSVLEILDGLSNLWSDEAYLQVISYDRTKDISLTGLASSNQAVSELLVKLNQSAQFTDTKFTYIRASRRNPTYPVEFGLSMKYKPKVTVTIQTVSEKNP